MGQTGPVADLLLRSVTLPHGTHADVVIDHGRITAVHPARSELTHDAAEVADLEGWVVLPAPAEPHAHLDKALTADLVPNPRGDLVGAVEEWIARYGERNVAEIADRARRAALQSLANGFTAVRTHVDVGEGIDMQAVEALLEVKADLADVIDLQLVALMGRPMSGDAGEPNRKRLREAMAMGVDVVGGCPHLDEDPIEVMDYTLAVATEFGCPLDLHMDEHVRAEDLDLDYLAERVMATGFDHGVVASHCVSLGMADHATQQRIAEKVAEAGISVVTLPITNLFLQCRDVRSAPPRGLTAVAALAEAGANVAGGADNLQDPFNTVGRADPFETATLLVVAAHLHPDAAYHAVSNAVRKAIGLPEIHLEPGAPAELLAVRAANIREAVAAAPADRIVIHQGRIVARTEISRVFPALDRS